MKTATAVTTAAFGQVLDQLRERTQPPRFCITAYEPNRLYVHWVRAFIRFHGVRHPQPFGSSEVEAFLSLAGERAQGFSLHRIVRQLALLFFTARCCARICQLGDRKTSAVMALAGWC